MKFNKGDQMVWKNTNKPAYEKVDDDEFGAWKSLEYKLDKPLDNRYGFKWTDQQTYDYFKNMMNFVKNKEVTMSTQVAM